MPPPLPRLPEFGWHLQYGHCVSNPAERGYWTLFRGCRLSPRQTVALVIRTIWSWRACCARLLFTLPNFPPLSLLLSSLGSIKLIPVPPRCKTEALEWVEQPPLPSA